ncbi:MAG: DUF86 domain-containing protein [Actinobacteria bacterium]|nr:DUF86 domain-containing protein [Actinomycetota bacterium]
MRSARNIVVHGYATIDRARIWQIAVERVPRVGEAVESLLLDLAQGRDLEQ